MLMKSASYNFTGNAISVTKTSSVSLVLHTNIYFSLVVLKVFTVYSMRYICKFVMHKNDRMIVSLICNVYGFYRRHQPLHNCQVNPDELSVIPGESNKYLNILNNCWNISCGTFVPQFMVLDLIHF